ncbi:hypothetical protein J6590_058530 [Homalodisca vitripennis]|nr:hypothetical protein J6590_058530 [Homalodisca vitripennis]
MLQIGFLYYFLKLRCTHTQHVGYEVQLEKISIGSEIKRAVFVVLSEHFGRGPPVEVVYFHGASEIISLKKQCILDLHIKIANMIAERVDDLRYRSAANVTELLTSQYILTVL